MLIALRLLLVMTTLTGIAYPALVTIAAQALFPFGANGSLQLRNGQPYGSALLAREVDRRRSFWPRPSACAYDPSLSGGSNAAPTSLALAESIRSRTQAFIEWNDLPPGTSVPAEMLTTSGSGLDPDISPRAAFLQVGRVATARGLPRALVERLVAEHAEAPIWGLWGEPRVNVQRLNAALESAPDE